MHSVANSESWIWSCAVCGHIPSLLPVRSGVRPAYWYIFLRARGRAAVWRPYCMRALREIGRFVCWSEVLWLGPLLLSLQSFETATTMERPTTLVGSSAYNNLPPPGLRAKRRMSAACRLVIDDRSSDMLTLHQQTFSSIQASRMAPFMDGHHQATATAIRAQATRLAPFMDAHHQATAAAIRALHPPPAFPIPSPMLQSISLPALHSIQGLPTLHPSGRPSESREQVRRLDQFDKKVPAMMGPRIDGRKSVDFGRRALYRHPRHPLTEMLGRAAAEARARSPTKRSPRTRVHPLASVYGSSSAGVLPRSSPRSELVPERPRLAPLREVRPSAPMLQPRKADPVPRKTLPAVRSQPGAKEPIPTAVQQTVRQPKRGTMDISSSSPSLVASRSVATRDTAPRPSVARADASRPVEARPLLRRRSTRDFDHTPIIASLDVSRPLAPQLSEMLLERMGSAIDTFQAWDTDGNNALDFDEFETALTGLGIKSLGIIKKFWKEVDKDGSGDISYTELAAALEPQHEDKRADSPPLEPSHREAPSLIHGEKMRQRRHAPRKKMRSAAEELHDAFAKVSLDHVMTVFRQWDANGDGTISRRELGEAMAELGLAITQTELNVLFNRVDTDNSGKIVYAELKGYLRNRNDQQHAADMARMEAEQGDLDHFKRLDITYKSTHA